jgi:Mn2+/Fe2+ NRAMP family transporter
MGTIGAAMVAAIVVSLAAAWGFGEVTGQNIRSSIIRSRRRGSTAPFRWRCVGGAIVVAVAPNLVALNIGVEVMNALLLPVVLGFLVLLAIKALPPEHRIKGVYASVVIGISVLVSCLGVYGAFSSAVNP